MSVCVESVESQLSHPHLDLKGIFTSFGHATSCFANAATALSSAAQSLAIAADALSKASNNLEAFYPGPLAASGSLTSPVTSKSPAPDDPAQNPTPANGGDVDKKSLDEEPDADNDDDYFVEENEDYIQALINRQLEEKMLRDNSVDSRLGSPTTPGRSLPGVLPTDEVESVAPRAPEIPISEILKHEPPFQRTLLVASEADVLPIACIFAQNHDKVLCYSDCPLPSIMLFQKIIKGVTGTSVYAATRASASELNTLCRAFNKQTKAILLMHETVHSELAITATDELMAL
ncbi:hypothetical protein FRC10_011989 [Ceratobasidium sp. 414]|nr:hypothetical protein FRC10_011989 [Ceratobasidium sp. 414]